MLQGDAMTLKLPPDVEQFIEDRVRSGEFASAQEVVRAGLRLLKARSEYGCKDDFQAGEWDRLLAEAENGKDMSFDEAVARRRADRGEVWAGQ
jgi:putative addiction module CopG family antidote